MKNIYSFLSSIFLKDHGHFKIGSHLTILLTLLLLIPSLVLAQKKGNNKQNNYNLTLYACVEDIGNGLYQVSFSYDNDNGEDIVVDVDKSYWTKKGVVVGNGTNYFKRGKYIKAFKTQFAKNESVEWEVVGPNGKIFVVIADANSVNCPQEETGFIFPVHGQDNGKTEGKLDLRLKSLAKGEAGENPSNLIYRINDNNEVLIEIIPGANQMPNLINLLKNTFSLQFNSNPNLSNFIIDPDIILLDQLTAADVFFPISRLLELENFESVKFASLLVPSFRNAERATSQGDTVQRTSVVRESFRILRDGEIVPVDGKGIKVGVISDSYDKQPFTGKSKATVDVENGDLPGIGNPDGYDLPVDVLLDFPYGEASDEGRAMLQILHDVAPASELAFHTGILSPRNFELAIKALQEANCDIIVDDITFPTEPFFGDGRISQAIENFTSQDGKLYFTSAGNFADNGYQATFSSSLNLPKTNFLTSGSNVRAHVFGTNPDGTPDILQKISVEKGVYMLVLQWEEDIASQDNLSGAFTDLDFYIVDDNGNLIVGNNRVNEDGDPTEIMVFQATGSGTANIMITSTNGAATNGLPFRFIAFRADGLEFLEYGGAPTVSGHAMTPAANAIAAVDYRTAQNPDAQAFSSFAGTLSSNQILQIKLSAPDGVDTNVSSIGQDIDGTGFPNFFGTSAAAPHAAGAFALLMSALPSWYPSGLPIEAVELTNIKADKALQLVKQTSIPAGDKDQAGEGLINMEAAFGQIAAQTANITQLVVEDGITPGATPFEVKILGEYLPSEPTVIFDGQELEIVSVSDKQIVAKVNTFSGNPVLIVETEGKTETGADKGISNGLTFYPDGKYLVNIIADNFSIEYGQIYEFSFHVEGLPEGVTYESTGLPEVKYSSPAVFPYPDVNDFYLITPFFEEVLSEEQQATYQINFVTGSFSVTKKDLEIKAEDVSITYGDLIEVPLTYNFEETGIANTEEFLSRIKTAHQSDFYENDLNNTLLLINGLNSNIARYTEILSFIEDGSWISTKSGIENGRRQLSIANNFVDLGVNQFSDYIDQTIINGRRQLSIANGRRQLSIANSEDLFDNIFDIAIENGRRQLSIANDSGLGDETDLNDYSKVFSVFDLEFTISDEEPELKIEKFYSINLITGNDVTTTEPHLIYPGAFINNMAANFNVLYKSGNLSVAPKVLTVEVADIEINYGDNPTELLSLTFDGFEYDETVEIVYPDGVPFYFVNAKGEEFEVEGLATQGVGTFDIRIREPKNYALIYGENHGKLIIDKKTLMVSSEDLEIKYGVLPFEQLTSELTGFVNDETITSVFPQGLEYYFIDSNNLEYDRNNFESIPGTGIYEIRVKGTDNYLIAYAEEHGKLEIIKATLAVTINDLTVKYGVNPQANLNVAINGFAFNDNVESVFSGGIEYNFSDLINTYTLQSKIPVGQYKITIIPPVKNYGLEYTIVESILTVEPAQLNLSTNDILITEGEPVNTNLITPNFSGFVYNESKVDVFPTGLKYTFINDFGLDYVVGDVGVFKIGVENPDNYIVNLDKTGSLYVTSFDDNLNNVRTYLDCVEYDANSTNGFKYVANFRYYNPNDVPVYVLVGPDNNLSSLGAFQGAPPVIFTPGEGVFSILFDGNKLYWNLTTFNGTQKTSISSEASLDSNKCDAKGTDTDQNTDYVVYPNPTIGPLTIKRNLIESGNVDVLNISGVVVASKSFKKNNSNDINLDISAQRAGIYFVRITTSSKIVTFEIIKN
ncbi:S8 family serine peptidase [Namhaeicola litoreus]|uniref:S8 family serine peptidase n=1 Tax=Namhaeicola litoreus TaxID=1052145 RepID=A0ABW3Y0S6_9FLAO